MEALNLVLPGNPRYQPKQLCEYFGYDHLFHTLAEVEIATLRVLGEIGVIPAEEIVLLTDDIIEQILAIPTTEVDRIEREITKHDIRAWVRKAQEILDQVSAGSLARWVHVPLTSYDPLDTGRILQFLRAYEKALKPAIGENLLLLTDLVERFAAQIQIGRTHGQHALPITVGFWLATILSRMLYNLTKIEEHAQQLVGKISGAVGAHNAQLGLGLAERCGERSFEERVLDKLGLKSARISTQILPPEPVGYFLFSCAMLSANLGQMGRDCRHLMRTEIAEVQEAFEAGQVGSSTMVHKRNPINFENLEGMWIRTKNEFGKVLDTLISEHQRDLVGSCVARDFPIILVNLMQQLNTLRRRNKAGVPFLARLTVNADACQANFERSAHLILAEPLYIALQMAGYQGDAHELVNGELVPIAQKDGRLLAEVLEEKALPDEELAEVISRIPDDVWQLLHQPENYTGDA
ncbi:MAG: lyase family protein, partial [Candidatus Odinarchaeia archaeon]